MKKLLVLFSTYSIMICVQTNFAQQKWANYENARFGYSVNYPLDLLAPQGEADNGDGQVFKSATAEMRVFGSNLLSNKNLLGEFNQVVKENENVSYKTFRKNYFVVSGIRDGKIFYQKTVSKPGGSFATLIIEYDQAEHGVYDKIVTKIAGSFR